MGLSSKMAVGQPNSRLSRLRGPMMYVYHAKQSFNRKKDKAGKIPWDVLSFYDRSLEGRNFYLFFLSF